MSAKFDIARSLWQEMSADDAGDLAAGLSYRFLLALFPFFIFLAALGGLVAPVIGIDNPSTAILDRIAVALPGDARSLLTKQLTEILDAQHSGLASIAILGAVWAAAGGMSATMRAMNIAYDVDESRPWWKQTGIAVGLTALSGGALIVAFIAAVAGGMIGATVAEVLGLQGAYELAVNVMRFLLPPVLLTLATAVLFWAAPDVDIPFRWITPGAVLFTVTWVIATTGFSVYVSNFGSYNATYGALGALVVLMLWFYISAYMMLAGAELNALLWKARTHDDPSRSKPAATERVAEETRRVGRQTGS